MDTGKAIDILNDTLREMYLSAAQNKDKRLSKQADRLDLVRQFLGKQL